MCLQEGLKLCQMQPLKGRRRRVVVLSMGRRGRCPCRTITAYHTTDTLTAAAFTTAILTATAIFTATAAHTTDVDAICGGGGTGRSTK